MFTIRLLVCEEKQKFKMANMKEKKITQNLNVLHCFTSFRSIVGSWWFLARKTLIMLKKKNKRKKKHVSFLINR